jgi:methionine-gamma-lyase
MPNAKRLKVQTRAVHAGEWPDPRTRAPAPNLVMSTTFLADPDAAFSVEKLGADAPFVYTRWGNPTVDQLERKLLDLEGAEACLAFASGMAAITGLFLHHLGAGDHLVMSDVAYAGASELCNDLLPKLGIQVTRVNTSDLDEVAAAITSRTKLIYVETPCNPILRLTDVAAVARIARNAGVRLAVDSTFVTPISLRPIELGADYVVHSLTKYLCGHGDAVGGALLGPKSELAVVRQKILIRAGGILSPFNAWLIMRGMATLPIRMRAHEEGATKLARFLESHPRVRRVIYPGLPSHPQSDLARRQMSNHSGMLTFQMDGGRDAARAVATRLRVFHYAVSLGHHRSLIFYLPTAELLETSFQLAPRQLESYRLFAGNGIFRVSVGLEDPDDLCEDLGQALDGGA